ncbi:unnamed protein product [Hapterophycus canaliculatus]
MIVCARRWARLYRTARSLTVCVRLQLRPMAALSERAGACCGCRLCGMCVYVSVGLEIVMKKLFLRSLFPVDGRVDFLLAFVYHHVRYPELQCISSAMFGAVCTGWYSLPS